MSYKLVVDEIKSMSTENLIVCYQELEFLVQGGVALEYEDSVLFVEYGKELKDRGVRL